MNAIVLLFTIGLILLAFEVLVPGAILGIMGGMALLAGVITAFLTHGVSGGLTAFAIALALVGLMLYIEFAIIPKTALGKRLFLRSAVVATSQPPAGTSELVGREAEALTTLAPSGYVSVGGQRYEAFSQSGMVGRGEKLRVVGFDNFRVIVSKIQLS